MQIKVTNIDILTGRTTIDVTHKNNHLYFVGSSIKRKYFEDYDQFDVLNRYLKTLPPEIHDNIFKLFVEIKRALEDVWIKNDLISKLEIYIRDLYNFIDFDNFRFWVSINVNLPELENNFAKEYVTSMDDVGSRDQTYLRSEYIDLITLSAMLRFMLPIWNEFMDKTKAEYGNTFKDYYAFKLLRESSIYNCKAMEKLRVYINYPIKANFDNTTMVLSGISTEDIPTYMLALVVIRRLAVGRIENNEPNVHLITFIYKYVFRTAQNTSNGKKAIKEKKIRKNEDEDEKESSLDRYKIKYQISIGEIAEIEFAIKNYEYLVNLYCPNLDRNIIRENLESIQVLTPVKLEDVQIILLSWIIHPLVPSRGLVYVNKETILIAMAVSQAILRELGYPFLAMLLTAYPDRESSEFITSSSETRSRIPKEMVEQLDYLFPFIKRTGRRGNIKGINPIINLITNMAISFNSINWFITVKEKYLHEVYGENATRRIIMPGDLKVDLTKCLIHLINVQNSVPMVI